jgi:hypothetical protein
MILIPFSLLETFLEGNGLRTLAFNGNQEED